MRRASRQRSTSVPHLENWPIETLSELHDVAAPRAPAADAGAEDRIEEPRHDPDEEKGERQQIIAKSLGERCAAIATWAGEDRAGPEVVTSHGNVGF